MADTKIVVLYHGNCPDGFGGAYAAWKKFGDAAEYIPLSRNDPSFPEVAGKEVYLIDYTYKQPQMDELLKQAASLVVLDHHEGAREVTESMPVHIFDANRSGAVIAWEYFHSGVPVPQLLSFIQDDDLYRFALPDTRAVLSYVTINPLTFEFWEETAAALDTPATAEALLQKCRIYAEYFVRLGEAAASQAKLVSFEGHECYFAVAHPSKPMKSLVGHLLAAKKGPFALVVSAHPNGYGVSIRGDGSIDVSKIAAKYGGSGHPDASGFKIPTEQPLPWALIEDHENTGD